MHCWWRLNAWLVRQVMADGELTVGRNCGPSDVMIGELVMFTGRTVLLVCLTAVLSAPVSASAQSEEVNKALARRFYEEVCCRLHGGRT